MPGYLQHAFIITGATANGPWDKLYKPAPRGVHSIVDGTLNHIRFRADGCTSPQISSVSGHDFCQTGTCLDERGLHMRHVALDFPSSKCHESK